MEHSSLYLFSTSIQAWLWGDTYLKVEHWDKRKKSWRSTHLEWINKCTGLGKPVFVFCWMSESCWHKVLWTLCYAKLRVRSYIFEDHIVGQNAADEKTKKKINSHKGWYNRYFDKASGFRDTDLSPVSRMKIPKGVEHKGTWSRNDDTDAKVSERNIEYYKFNIAWRHQVDPVWWSWSSKKQMIVRQWMKKQEKFNSPMWW